MIKLYYSSNSSLGKQTLAYVSASKKEILAIDLSKTKLTGTQWIEIAEALDTTLSSLVNQNHPDFTKNYGEKEIHLSNEDWIKVLHKNPEVLKGSIVMVNHSFYLLETPTDFIKYFEPDTAGLNPQKPHED
ncbi:MULTISPECIES: arsenate reductase family protein [unclassified Lacinutrix]